jgi:hypothetical protein
MSLPIDDIYLDYNILSAEENTSSFLNLSNFRIVKYLILASDLWDEVGGGIITKVKNLKGRAKAPYRFASVLQTHLPEDAE